MTDTSITQNSNGATPPTHYYMKPSIPKFEYIDSGEKLAHLTEDDLYSEIMECGVPLLDLIARIARGYQKGNPVALLSKAIGVAACDAPGTLVATGVAGEPIPLNFMFCLVGPSGLGKGITLDARMSCANPLGGYRLVTPASGEALIDSFFERVPAADGKGEETQRHADPVWAVWGEIDTLAAKASNANSTLDGTFRSLWSGERAGDESITRKKAGMGCIIDARSYRFVMFVGAQPDHAGVLLDDDTGGVLQRLLWLPLTDDDALETSKEIEAHKRGLEKLLGSPKGAFEFTSPDLKVWGTRQVTVSPEVIDIMRMNRSRILRRVEELDPLDAHIDNLCARLAAVFAGWRAGAGNPAVIDKEAWWWGQCVVEYSRRTRSACIVTASNKKIGVARAAGKTDAERFLARADHLDTKQEIADDKTRDRVFEILSDGLWRKGAYDATRGARAGDIARYVPVKKRKRTQEFLNYLVGEGSLLESNDEKGRVFYEVDPKAANGSRYTGS